MKRGFVRTIWGDYSFKRRHKLDNDILLLKNNKYEDLLDATIFVYGEENFKILNDNNFNCVLVDKKPFVWKDSEVCMFRHKLEVFKIAFDYFEEFIFLDLDCMLIKPLPNNFWEDHYKKDSIQASLMQYKSRKAYWRKDDKRKVPCACYVYIRDKDIPLNLINLWNDSKRETEEQIIAKYTDNLYGGWNGIDHYWSHFEPEFYVFNSKYLDGYWVWKDSIKFKKNIFKHFHEDKEVQDQLLLKWS